MVDRGTAEVYELGAARWAADRRPVEVPAARDFRRWAASGPHAGTPSADLGCGPGWYSRELAQPVLALDVAGAMLDLVPRHAPDAWRVQADLEALPLRSGALGSAWASRSYVHVARQRMPMALADLHRSLGVGARVELRLFGGDREHDPHDGDDFPGRRFSAWPADLLTDVLVGAGFESVDVAARTNDAGHLALVARAVRGRTLADTVGPRMRLLVCGLNPSLYAADAGVGFARPGNRFWPAAQHAGLVSIDRDARQALVRHGVGMTDLVKRATVAAAELDAEEYRSGLARVERLCRWLRPAAVAFVGLAGWRAAVDRTAAPGVQPGRIGGCAAYVLPSTSGLNARTRLTELADHLRAAAALADAELSRWNGGGAPSVGGTRLLSEIAGWDAQGLA